MKRPISLLFITIITTVLFAQGDIKNEFYIKIGYSLPSKNYYDDDKLGMLNEFKKIGGVLEMGNLYVINALPLADGLRIGVNIDFVSVTGHLFTNKDILAKYYNAFLGSKVGPSLLYSPINKLSFELFGKINPVWVSGIAIDYDDGVVDDQTYIGFFNMKYSYGLTIRYRMFLAGIDINPGQLKLKNVKEQDQYFSNFNDGGDKVSMNSINFVIGFNF